MSYLGNQPAIGKFTLCDTLTPDGSTTTFSLTSSSNAVVPGSVNAMLVSINGVIQAPSTYSINGSQIIFSTAPGSGDVIDQIRVFGSVLNVGNVSDGTIGLANLTATGTKDATTFLRGDNSFAVPSYPGKVLQVVSTEKSDTFSSSSTSFTDITGMSVAITPSSSSNKILVLVDIKMGSSGSQTVRLLRDSTVIYKGDTASNRPLGFGNVVDLNQYDVDSMPGIFLDSPSTTSATTYKIQAISSGATYYVNRTLTDRDTAQYDPRLASSITVIEIGA